MKHVTIKDVAERAGVSTGTVSRVLSDRPEISDATKRRIREICREMGYVPNMAARSLVKKASHTLGLIIPDISNPFFSEMALEIEMEARRLGYHLLICNTTREENREYEAAEQMLRRQVDGIIVSPTTPESMEHLRSLFEGLPVVYLGDNHGGECSFVSADNVRGGYLGGQYLAELGHRRVAFLGGRSNSLTSHCRIRGFLQAMEEYDCEGSVVECPLEMNGEDRYSWLAMEYLAKKPSVTAVFAYSDRFALGVIQAASELKLRIPQDLSLLGYNNSAYAAFPHINLSSVSNHNRVLGRTAVKRLVDRINGTREFTRDVLEPELVIRGSCCRVSEGTDLL